MRALRKNYHLFIWISLLIAAAALLFLFPLFPSSYAAESAVYLEADVTFGGEKLPSSVLYTGSAPVFDFNLYHSSDATLWEKDSDSSHRANFSLKYFDADRRALSSAPSLVGTYFVRVVAEDTLNGYRNTAVTPLVISHGVVIGESRYSIVKENLSLFSSALDGVSTLVLDDAHTDFYSSVLSGTSLRVEGQALTAGTDYSLSIEYYSRLTSSFETTISCAEVGTYRLVARILSSVDLSKTEATSALQTDGSGNRYLYREFSVSRAALSLSLTTSSMYVDRASAVTLSDASKAKLLAVGSYETKVIAPSSFGGNSEVGRVLTQGSGAVSFTPSEVGAYVYRVTFTSSSASYGVAAGDYTDLSFAVTPVPYTVSYSINNDADDLLDYVIMNSGAGAIELSPLFFDLSSSALTSVYTASGERKFSVSYQVYNTALGSWQAVASGYPGSAGRYRVIVTFSSYARVTSDYNIDAGTEIVKEFQIVTGGTLGVTAANGGVNYYTGSGVVPALLFFSQGGDVGSSLQGLYSIDYYQANGSLIGSSAPSAVGSYFFEVCFTSAVPSLGVAAGDLYRGAYSVVYRPLSVTFEDGSFSFSDRLTASSLPLALGTDYSVSYYAKSGAAYSLLSAAPSLPGDYFAVALFSSALSVYNVKAGDIAAYHYKIAGANTWASVSTASIDLTFDGGVKEPILSFYNGASSIDLSELVDYQVSYFAFDSSTESYLPSSHPLYSGDYQCLVTFLRSDEEKGIVRGGFTSVSFTLSQKDVTVTYTLKEESADLVYDGVNKDYSVSLTADARPLDLSFTVEYAIASASPVYRVEPYKAAGNYYVRTTLANDRNGSLNLVGRSLAFTVQKLSVDVLFTVPLSYRAMYTGSAVSPSVTFGALNGRYADQSYKTAGQFASVGISLGISDQYYSSDNGVDYLTATSPVRTGAYRHEVSSSNDSVLFSSASSVGDDGSTVSSAYVWETEANVIFSVIPCEVEVRVTFDSDLYYTTAAKGVSSVAFYAYDPTTDSYSTAVSAFSGDYKIYYFTSDYQGVVSGTGSESKPTQKSYYVARVVMQKDGVSDAYLSEERYTFLSGKTELGADMEGSPVADGCYVDFVFRIKDQTRLDVHFEMPQTFAFDGSAKAIDATFVNRFSTVPFQAGVDYAVTYIEDGGAESATAPSAVGRYEVKFTFLRDNTAYRIGDTLGSYEPQNALYISSNDVILYAFEIFAPREMTVDWQAPASFYYDGTEKAYVPSFTVQTESGEGIVMLTYDTHYRVRYYALADGVYSPLSSAPSLPGNYAVEVYFLIDLWDYTINVNGTLVPLRPSELVSVADGGFDGATLPKARFEIKKAVLKVGGVSPVSRQFDGTYVAAFSGLPTLSVKEEGGVRLGEMVKVNGAFPFSLSGSIEGAFETCLPGSDISINLSSFFALTEGASDLYDLEHDAFRASITKSAVDITPVDVSREYNPFAVESVIRYSASYSEETLSAVFPNLSDSDFLVGELSREKGTAVGWYPISVGTLVLNDALAGTVTLDGSEVTLSDLFELKIENAGYRIRERAITIEVEEGQYKLYGEADPVLTAVVSSGSLIYNDVIVGTPHRAEGENAGEYRVTLSAVSIRNGAGDDVSANYNITLKNGTFEVRKRRITVSPVNQSVQYTVGFDRTAMNVLDRDHDNRNITEAYITNPVAGDRISGVLSSEPTDDPFVFRITRGTVTVVNSSGKSVISNYDLYFDTSRTYTVVKTDITVRISENAVLSKYYGDQNPVIAFTIEKTEKEKLGSLTLSTASSIGREAGEDAGTYRVLVDNSASSFIVTDSGVDVSRYFNFNVRGVTYGDTMFTILPRPITVTVESQTFENTGRDILPTLKYMNANGTRLSATVLASLKVQYGVPAFEPDDGANAVTPIVVGEVETDPNFTITVLPGTITMIYLQNVVTATAVASSDPIYKQNKRIFAGIMLYKTVRLYKLDTANGEQPDRKVSIALPLDKDLKGDGFVAVALYSSKNPKAFTLSQSGATLVYADNGTYYVAIAQAEEWFYIIWGVVCIAAGVLIYFLVVAIVKLAKKSKAKKEAMAPELAAKKAEKERKKREQALAKGGKRGFISVATPKSAATQTQNSDSDDLFSDSNVALPDEPVKAKEEEIVQENTDDLFASSADEIGREDEVEPSEPIAEDDKKKSKKDKKEKKTKGKKTVSAFVPSSEPQEEKAEEPKENTDSLFESEPEDKKKKKDKKEAKSKESKADKKKEDKKSKKGKSSEPKGFRPMAFTPSGAKGSASPTRSFEDDLFLDDEFDVPESSAVSPYGSPNDVSNDVSDDVSDDEIVIPDSSSHSDDDLVIAKSNNFFNDDDSEEDKKDDDPDMI